MVEHDSETDHDEEPDFDISMLKDKFMNFETAEEQEARIK